MDVGRSPSVRSRNFSPGFATALASAVLEWILIFMLFIDASFSYMVTKFARCCELQIPCLLCSRLDYVLGKERMGFYSDLICGNHKLEISCLVVCHVHNKLVDVHGMCESCLFSFATVNKSNAETYRLLVGKMGADPQVELDHEPLIDDHNLGSSSIRNCSCCNEQWISRGYAQKLLQTTSIGSHATELDEPLSVTIGHDGADLNKIGGESSMSFRVSHPGKNGFDLLSHIEYTKVKITSDTESEVPVSDDDNASALIRETEDPKDDFDGQCVQLEPCIISLADDLTSEKSVHTAFSHEPSLLESKVLLEVIKDTASVPGLGLEELNWQQVQHEADIASPSELISFDEVPPSNFTQTPFEVLGETLDAPGTGEIGKKSVTESGEISMAGSEPITTTETHSEVNPVTTETGSQMPNYLDLGDAYKLAVGNRGRQLSGMLLEQMPLKGSARVSEDLKLLLSQISAARGIELLLNDMSPRVSGNTDELKTSDASTSIGMQLLQKRISLERNESGLSLDGSTVSEIEGESVVDRLKRQFEHDRKLMSALYKELEEERNASSVAANQAMAMITRLQEEKAALHMEALQYLRMMEEQAEYDGEALQKANDLLADKEKEIQDLEAELEFNRRKFGDVSTMVNVMESNCDLKSGDIRVEHSDSSSAKNSSIVFCNSVCDKHSICEKIDGTTMSFGDKNKNSAESSLLEFEDEKLYILQCLKKLEEKLDLFSNNWVYLDMADGEDSGKEGNNGSDELNCGGRFQENDGREEDELLKNILIPKGSPSAQEGSVLSYERPQHITKESSKVDSDGQRVSVVCTEIELVALRNEFSDLSGRLEALEADRCFLEHSINSLRNGNEGLKFIREIACHLQELHKIGIRKRDQPFS